VQNVRRDGSAVRPGEVVISPHRVHENSHAEAFHARERRRRCSIGSEDAMRKRASGVAVVFTTSPVIDRAETIRAVPGQMSFINNGTPHGFKNATQSTATAVEVFVK
jgi:hypothetical protein